jgi:hypothetical protein
MIKQEKDCGIRASGIREVLGGKIRADGGDHFEEAPSDPAGRIGLSVTLSFVFFWVFLGWGIFQVIKFAKAKEAMEYFDYLTTTE